MEEDKNVYRGSTSSLGHQSAFWGRILPSSSLVLDLETVSEGGVFNMSVASIPITAPLPSLLAEWVFSDVITSRITKELKKPYGTAEET